MVLYYNEMKFSSTLFSGYIQLRFKHAVLGTHLSYPRCLSRTVVNFYRREEGVVALHLPIESLKTRSGLEPLRTGAGNEMKMYITGRKTPMQYLDTVGHLIKLN